MPGANPDAPDFVPGDIVTMNTPFAGEAGRGEVTLGGQRFSIGSLLVFGEEGLRLEDGVLAFQQGARPLFFVADGALEIADDLTIELRDGTPFFMGEGARTTLDGTFMGDGGLEKAGPGTLVLGTASMHRGPTLVSGGTLEIGDRASLAGDVAVSGGTLVNSGSIGGDVAVNAGAFTNAGGTIRGRLQIEGGVVTLEGGTLEGGLTNTGGELRVSGAVTEAAIAIENDRRMTISQPMDLNGGTLMNTGTLVLGADLTGVSVLRQDGTVTTSGPDARPRLVANEIRGGAASLFDLRGDGVVGLGLAVEANLSEGARLAFASGELTGVVGAETPRIDWTGTLPTEEGAVVLDFGLDPGDVAIQGQRIPVLRVTAPDVSGVSAVGLPGAGGPVTAFLRFDSASRTFEIVTAASPSLGGVIKAVDTVDRLIDPAFRTTGQAMALRTRREDGRAEPRGDCLPGASLRGLGGRSSAKRIAHSSLGDGTALSQSEDVRIRYLGVSLGIDMGCRAVVGGWDMAGGVHFGWIEGSTSQDVRDFTVDPLTAILIPREGPGAILSALRSDFSQFRGGGYLAFAQAGWIGEIHLDHAHTRYTFDSVGAAPLPLDGVGLSTDRTTVTGRVSRVFDLGGGLSVMPGAGLAVARSASRTVHLIDPGSVSAGRLELERHTSLLAVGGVGLEYRQDNGRGSSSTRYSLDAELVGDLGAGRRATYTQAGGASNRLSTEPLRGFGRVGAGVTHSRSFGSGRPFDRLELSFRGDVRAHQGIRGYGGGAQVRLEF